MRKQLLTLICILGCLSFRLAAVPVSSFNDTLILNDGRILTGKVDAKSLEILHNTQANINTASTLLDQPQGKPIKVSNKEVKYFIIDSVKYANRLMTGGNKFMRVIIEGKASLYSWAGNATVYGTQDAPGPGQRLNNGVVIRQQVETKHTYDIGTRVLFINGKNYTPNPKWLKKQFASLFGACPKLVEESKKSGFNFDDLEEIVKKYNACF